MKRLLRSEALSHQLRLRDRAGRSTKGVYGPMAIPFVGVRFDLQGFATYLSQVQLTTFQPKFVTLHHTASPSLAQRPAGFTGQHLQNLLHYYQNQLGWSGAPHLFIDDQAQPIIVFQRLDRRGVHAASFNPVSWGVEMLGNYDSESFSSGRGATVRGNALQALAAMCRRLGVGAETIRFHRDDPKTKKTCPGVLVKKADVVAGVAALLQQQVPGDLTTPSGTAWTVVLPGGKTFVPVHDRDGRPIVRIRSFLTEIGAGGNLALAPGKTVVRWTRPGGITVELAVAELDETGAAWGLVRTVAEAAGRTLQVQGSQVTVL